MYMYMYSSYNLHLPVVQTTHVHAHVTCEMYIHVHTDATYMLMQWLLVATVLLLCNPCHLRYHPMFHNTHADSPSR